ncbi:MAG: DUF3105 domain-containing protein [Solirubrobacteraceae bacterium]
MIVVVASLALAIGLIILLSGYFAGRDQAGISSAAQGPGIVFRDQGDARLRSGELRAPYDSNPPTSGAHVSAPVLRDSATLNDDQLLQALSLGNVVMIYGSRMPPPGLPALAREVAGPFTPALEASGQAVILARRPETPGVIGLAWAHMVRVRLPADPVLRQFAQFWLGRGAPSR